jgi:hypothetical protein
LAFSWDFSSDPVADPKRAMAAAGQEAHGAFGIEDAHVEFAWKKAIKVGGEVSRRSELSCFASRNGNEGEGEPVSHEDTESPDELGSGWSMDRDDGGD